MDRPADLRRLKEALLLEAEQVVARRLSHYPVAARVGLVGEVGIRVTERVTQHGQLPVVEVGPTQQLPDSYG